MTERATGTRLAYPNAQIDPGSPGGMTPRTDPFAGVAELSSVLTADVHRVCLVHHVRSTLTVADQRAQKLGSALTNLGMIPKDLCVLSRRIYLGDRGNQLRHELAQLDVLLGQPLDLEGQPRR